MALARRHRENVAYLAQVLSRVAACVAVCVAVCNELGVLKWRLPAGTEKMLPISRRCFLVWQRVLQYVLQCVLQCVLQYVLHWACSDGAWRRQ